MIWISHKSGFRNRPNEVPLQNLVETSYIQFYLYLRSYLQDEMCRQRDTERLDLPNSRSLYIPHLMINSCFSQNFSLHHRVQKDSGSRPASYPVGTIGSFPEGKAVGTWSWPLTSFWCRSQRIRRTIPPPPNMPSWRCAHLKNGDTFTCAVNHTKLGNKTLLKLVG
jgi:hypothetical protein